MFKNQLQELAQRSCYNMPSYSCFKEGPDHAPKFKATVNFNGEVFESPGYFATLRHAEHAAAEIALRDLQTRSSPLSTSKILDESGVCKNLLQENAQRAGVPLPVYSTRKSGPGHQPVFTCTVEVAAMQFTGEPAKTKKQAEKNAALSAWTSLRKKAGRKSGAPVEECDVTDEQEQKLIADILMNNLSERQPVKSSPAALAENHFHRAGISPALLPSGPLYSRQHSRVQPTPDSASPSLPAGALPAASSASAPGPLYRRHHSRVGGDVKGGGVPSGPMYKPRHVNAHWVGQSSGALGGQMPPADPSNVMVGSMRQELLMGGGNMYGIPSTHSSPHMHSHMPAAVRSSLPSNSLRPDHSLPSFPTQPLVSQSFPSFGLSGQDQLVPTASDTSPHTNLAIRPGMAYQPRSARALFQSSGQLPVGSRPRASELSWSGTSSGSVCHTSSVTTVYQSWGPAPGAMLGGGLGVVGVASCVGIPAVMATGNRGAVDGSLEEDDAQDNQQVEHTTRLMLSHLCLE